MLAKKITSLQHPFVQRASLLRKEAKFRKTEQSVFISGETLVKELARQFPLKALITENPEPNIRADEHYLVSKEILKKMTGLVHPDGFAAELAYPEEGSLANMHRILVLDHLSDPGNLGTILRSAEAFGWNEVVVTLGTVDVFNDKAIRASRGAVFRLKIARHDPKDILEWASEKQATLYVADLEGKLISEIENRSPKALVLSSEAQGVRAWTENIGQKVRIPMQECSESLNVAIAGAILLFMMRGA